MRPGLDRALKAIQAPAVPFPAPLSRLDVATLDTAASLLLLAGHGMIAAQLDGLHARLTVDRSTAAALVDRASARATLSFDCL